MKPTTLRQVTPKAWSSASSSACITEELRRYDDYLRDVRGLAAETRRGRIRVTGLLLQQKFNGRAVDIRGCDQMTFANSLPAEWRCTGQHPMHRIMPRHCRATFAIGLPAVTRLAN